MIIFSSQFSLASLPFAPGTIFLVCPSFSVLIAIVFPPEARHQIISPSFAVQVYLTVITTARTPSATISKT